MYTTVTDDYRQHTYPSLLPPFLPGLNGRDVPSLQSKDFRPYYGLGLSKVGIFDQIEVGPYR